MLDALAYFRFLFVGMPHRLPHTTLFPYTTLFRSDEAILVQERRVGRRSVGGIGPHPARRIAAVGQDEHTTAVLIDSGIGGRPLADEAKTAIDRNMVLIAKERDCQMDGSINELFSA